MNAMNWQMLAILASGRMTTTSSRSKDLDDLDLQTRLKYKCLGSDEETVFAVHTGLVSILMLKPEELWSFVTKSGSKFGWMATMVNRCLCPQMRWSFRCLE